MIEEFEDVEEVECEIKEGPGANFVCEVEGENGTLGNYSEQYVDGFSFRGDNLVKSRGHNAIVAKTEEFENMACELDDINGFISLQCETEGGDQ